MNRGVRVLGISLVFGVLGAVAPVLASAYVFTFNPTHVDFGNRQFGSHTTAGITFAVSCDGPSDPDCAPGGGYAPERLAIAPDSYTQDNNCGSGPMGTMAPTPLMAVSCTITVTFSPPGERNDQRRSLRHHQRQRHDAGLGAGSGHRSPPPTGQSSHHDDQEVQEEEEEKRRRSARRRAKKKKHKKKCKKKKKKKKKKK